MKDIREAAVERRLVDAVRELGGVAFKFVSPGNDGVPDRLVLLPGGRIYFVEVKREGGKLRPNQRLQVKRIEELGFPVFRCEGFDGVQAFLGIIRV